MIAATRTALGIAVVLGLALSARAPAHAEDPAPIQVTIKDRRFSPSEIHVKSGQPSFLEITNADPTPEEFELRQLAIEKLIPGGGHARVRLRPLGPGRYQFIGEFNADTAQGVVIAE
jgi:hypothetical protein